jgi:hypothetical protein
MVARLFLVKYTKKGKINQMIIKYTKWPQKTNGRKIYQNGHKM